MAFCLHFAHKLHQRLPEKVKATKAKDGDSLSDKEKKELTAEEKEYKSNRKLIQEKLGRVS